MPYTNNKVSYLVHIHSLHCHVQSLDNSCHRASNLLHSNSSLNTRSNSVNSGTQTKVIKGLVLLTNCILCIDSGSLHIALLYRLTIQNKYRERQSLPVLVSAFV